VVYIKNEVGDEDLDTKLVRGQNIVSRELLNGCICCTLVGPFISAINEVIASYQPDRIIIESAGTADPAALALMVGNHPQLLRDGVISVVDVVNFDGYQDISEVARRQAKLTDLIVFNKVELVNDDRKRAVVGYVREFNEYSPIVEASKGRLDPRVAFGIESKLQVEMLQVASEEIHDHEKEDQINAVTITLEAPISKDQLDQILVNLPKNVFRVKGFVNLEGIGWRVLNGVFKRYEYFEFEKPAEVTESKLICIGYQIDKTLTDQLFASLFAHT
jgi:G3E family GTPase